MPPLCIGAAMKRREFIKLFGSAAAAWPLEARAQQKAMPVVGFIHSQSPDPTTADRVREFRQGLKETGYIDGENVVIEIRWAEGQFDRLPALVAELVTRKVSVIAATGGPETALAAKRVGSDIPIVFVTGRRSSRTGPGSKLEPARRQHHWRNSFHSPIGTKTTGSVAGDCSRRIRVMLCGRFPSCS